jgi:hypothetical protein
MSYRIKRHETGLLAGLWVIESIESNEIVASVKSNAEAWRRLDRINDEPVSASEFRSEIKEEIHKPTEPEKQSFYSGLIFISEQKGYKPGWAWHKFHEKFGHVPDGLHRHSEKPTKSLWGWVNRKAIAKAKK